MINIITPTGCIPINDIKKGDSILDHTGSIQSVECIGNEVEDDIYYVKLVDDTEYELPESLLLYSYTTNVIKGRHNYQLKSLKHILHDFEDHYRPALKIYKDNNVVIDVATKFHYTRYIDDGILTYFTLDKDEYDDLVNKLRKKGFLVNTNYSRGYTINVRCQRPESFIKKNRWSNNYRLTRYISEIKKLKKTGLYRPIITTTGYFVIDNYVIGGYNG